jgi:hypothetical protein
MTPNRVDGRLQFHQDLCFIPELQRHYPQFFRQNLSITYLEELPGRSPTAEVANLETPFRG